jgi:2-polyprenyl-6-methoxyphenol hydroxylase-like FAD-dependent oxidoreductase
MTKQTSSEPLGERAVVVGASMAGLFAARVLSEGFSEVVVIDRDDLPDRAEPRTRVPQGRHPHLLLTAGTRLLEGWFPGIVAELEAAGAVEIDLCADFLWHQGGGLQRRPASRLRGPSMSRPLLEHTVRRRVSRLPNVSIRSGETASGLLAEGERITAVRLGTGDQVPSDLVVDATGRQARSFGWIGALGFDPPQTSVVEVGTTYVTRRFQRNTDPARDWKAAGIIGAPESKRITMALPMEDDQWVVMVAGLNGESAPTDELGLLAYARTFQSPVIADLMRQSEPTGPIVTHRFPTNQRRHVEKLRSFPLAWLPIGDAVCSFDPIYGQGITSAAQQATALARCLDRARALDRSFSRAYFKAAARVVAVPWSIAVGGDFAYTGTTGAKPFGTDLSNRYNDQVVIAGQRDDAVVVRFNEVISLMRRPESLLAPWFVARVLYNAWRVRRSRTARSTGPPVVVSEGSAPAAPRLS